MQPLFHFLLALVLTLAATQPPQSKQPVKSACGTDLPQQQITAELARRQMHKLAAAVTPSPNNPVYLPLAIHLTRPDNGSSNWLTNPNLDVIVRDVNQLWAASGIQFFIYGDVDYINSTFWTYIPDRKDNENALRRVNSDPNAINLYFTDLEFWAGISSYSAAEDQGILLDYESVYVDGANVIAHELGHYLDLYHTHDAPLGPECPNGTACATTGDLVCDTPADPGLYNPITEVSRVNESCVYDNSAPLPANCDQTPYNPPVYNLMSYSPHTCRREFTPGQISRALQTLNAVSNRVPLLTSGAHYVDPKASGANTQCSYQAPCNSLAKALAVSTYGQAILLKPGTYQTPSFKGKNVTLLKWGNSGLIELRP